MSNLALFVLPGLVFGASVLLILGGYMVWSGLHEKGAESASQRIRRLSAASADQSKLKNISVLARKDIESPLARALLGIPRLNSLDRFLEQAGVKFGPAAALGITAASAFGGLLLAMMFLGGPGLLSLLAGLGGGGALPWLILSRKRAKRRDLMVKQLPDAMDFFARSMRAGHPFASALKSAGEEIMPPLSAEFEIAFDELNYGLEFEEAMQNMARRINSEEIRFFVTAVLVQKSTGGNLAELMNRLASLLRERMRTRGEVMIQAADMKSSARILIFLPFFVAGLIHLFNPGYLPVLLESDTGRTILGVQAVLMVLGYLVIQKMINFRI